MKKFLLAFSLLLLMASTKLAIAATPTPNLTATQIASNLAQTAVALTTTATYIQTAFPTLTPTLTPTGTITPSNTFTPSPRSLKNDYRARVYFRPQDLTQDDGVTVLGATPLPGAANSWLAQSMSQTVAVLSTGAAKVRLGMTIPWNYKGGLRLYALMGAQTIGDNVTITASIMGQSFNKTTLTAGTYSYTPPTGGAYAIPGAATSILAGRYASDNPLWDTPVCVVSRVQMPLAVAASYYSNANPLLVAGIIRSGDVLNFSIARATAGVDNVYIYGLEVQYDFKPDIPQ